MTHGDLVVNCAVPVVMGTVLLGTLTIVIANLIVDVDYGYLDPRIRPAR